MKQVHQSGLIKADGEISLPRRIGHFDWACKYRVSSPLFLTWYTTWISHLQNLCYGIISYFKNMVGLKKFIRTLISPFSYCLHFRWDIEGLGCLSIHYPGNYFVQSFYMKWAFPFPWMFPFYSQKIPNLHPVICSMPDFCRECSFYPFLCSEGCPILFHIGPFSHSLLQWRKIAVGHQGRWWNSIYE